MSEHVLKKGCCPICDADEITILRAHCNDGWTAALREQTRAQAAEALAAARLEVLRSLVERGPCPVCHSEGECAPDCRLARAIGTGG